MKAIVLFICTIVSLNLLSAKSPLFYNDTIRHPSDNHGFSFPDLANTWDEALPMGNGLLGALIWQKNGKLRISIDRSDLWDKRPLEFYKDPRFTYDTITSLVKKGDIKTISDVIKYNEAPGPSKIPAGAIQFDISGFGKIKTVDLNIKTAISTIEWENGTKFLCFIHATRPIGWYKFYNLPSDVNPEVSTPDYAGKNAVGNTSWQAIKNLNYPDPVVKRSENSITYDQKCWDDFSFSVKTEWNKGPNVLEGKWSISTGDQKPNLSGDMAEDLKSHRRWWTEYWQKSSISIPDITIERQYYRDVYKFGAVARRGAPAISLQAVWTPDNDMIAPWFGDFHNDLNTQLSYWPAYSGNRLNEAMGFLEWHQNNIPEYKKYSRSYFKATGMNIPGISTIEGKPMGSWVQYSLSTTSAGWIAQHFYLHWRYSMDRKYLKSMGYPWLKDVALFFKDVSTIENGKRSISLSASPEIYDNSQRAWFSDITNFDLSIIRFTYKAAAEMAEVLGKNVEAQEWREQLETWPDLALGLDDELLLAPQHPLKESHRHHSHLMGIHPLGLIDIENGDRDKKIITASLKQLEELGTKKWVGYSFPWQATLNARNYDGNGAADALRIFANAFCLKNSFHINGDQTKSGYSTSTYRAFTLEGNFAFAAAVQEMLIQSHAGFINIFPAIPLNWEDVSFKNLRTEGAFLVSAKKVNGVLRQIVVKSEKGGFLKIRNTFNTENIDTNNKRVTIGEYIEIKMSPGEILELNSMN